MTTPALPASTRPRAALATDLALSLALAAPSPRSRHKGSQGQAMDDGKILPQAPHQTHTLRASACPRQARRKQPSASALAVMHEGTHRRTHVPRRPAHPCARSPQPQGAGCANQKARVRLRLQSKATRANLPPRLATAVGYGARSSGETRRGGWGRKRARLHGRAGGVSTRFFAATSTVFGVHNSPRNDLTKGPKRAA